MVGNGHAWPWVRHVENGHALPYMGQANWKWSCMAMHGSDTQTCLKTAMHGHAWIKHGWKMTMHSHASVSLNRATPLGTELVASVVDDCYGPQTLIGGTW